MLLRLFKNGKLKQDIVTIEYKEMNHKINKIVEIIEQEVPFVVGEYRGNKHNIDVHEILYFESIDKMLFIYTHDMEYLSKLTLKDIEDSLNIQKFIRINKSMIVNIYKVKEIKTDVNMRLLAYLTNGEVVKISRHYRDYFFYAIKQISL